ncbi:unnamed protein product [Medioppia subpectinata]|uniref:Uncharacterized protein n=1 Tax=Medioppia subpectinata TaxID=1979941 RepID=A0A7R9PX54_9ACAR|nr:unnamed protein product [Medioppia subpectinata]CAG2104438.1 unnamed protein product [Medioppia subpectinata]
MNGQSFVLIMTIQFCLIYEYNVSQHNTNDEEVVGVKDINNNNNRSNCSYFYEEVVCDCDETALELKCYNIEASDDLIFAFNHVLNVTKNYYWTLLEVHCINPFDSVTKTYHISADIFTNGPKFERIVFVGDCSKAKHYDNLLATDRDTESVFMTKNTVRMATTCNLFQTKLERLQELTITDSLMAGDMISATFSTKCLGQYGTRNEALPMARLRIVACNLTLIESGAFFNLAELQAIDLSDNQLTHLSRQAFASHLYKLRSFVLRNNRLTALSTDFFDKLPQLRALDLSGNLLTALPFVARQPRGVQ